MSKGRLFSYKLKLVYRGIPSVLRTGAFTISATAISPRSTWSRCTVRPSIPSLRWGCAASKGGSVALFDGVLAVSPETVQGCIHAVKHHVPASWSWDPSFIDTIEGVSPNRITSRNKTPAHKTNSIVDKKIEVAPCRIGMRRSIPSDYLRPKHKG